MKKYRLIEYNPNIKNVLTERGTFDTKEKVFTELLYRTTNTPNLYYRIEEVEEVEEVEERIMDRVKSYEDACKVLGIDDPFALSYTDAKYNGGFHICFKTRKSFGGNGYSYGQFQRLALPPHIIALLKLETITAALNEGWKPDCNDTSQLKWRVMYHKDKDAFVIAASNCCSVISPRLCLKSPDLAGYAAKRFSEFYKELLIEKF